MKNNLDYTFGMPNCARPKPYEEGSKSSPQLIRGQITPPS